MIVVTRTRLDDGSPTAARETDNDLTIAIDDRHITDAGAKALQRTLNCLGAKRRRREAPKPDSDEHGA